jgi:hypothetical protein
MKFCHLQVNVQNWKTSFNSFLKKFFLIDKTGFKTGCYMWIWNYIFYLDKFQNPTSAGLCIMANYMPASVFCHVSVIQIAKVFLELATGHLSLGK